MTALPEVLEKLERATPGPWSYCGQSGGHACTCGLVWGAGDHSPAVAEFSLADEEYEGHRPATEERQFNTEAAVMAVNWLREHGPALLRDAWDGWRSIESAPRDGSYILVCNSHGSWIAKYHPVYPSGYRPSNPWASMMLNHDHIEKPGRFDHPTHWRPLPQPPAMHAPGGED